MMNTENLAHLVRCVNPTRSVNLYEQSDVCNMKMYSEAINRWNHLTDSHKMSVRSVTLRLAFRWDKVSHHITFFDAKIVNILTYNVL